MRGTGKTMFGIDVSLHETMQTQSMTKKVKTQVSVSKSDVIAARIEQLEQTRQVAENARQKQRMKTTVLPESVQKNITGRDTNAAMVPPIKKGEEIWQKQ